MPHLQSYYNTLLYFLAGTNYSIRESTQSWREVILGFRAGGPNVPKRALDSVLFTELFTGFTRRNITERTEGMMTNEELEEVLCECPTLYHMAQRGAWPAIRERGLLSTTALLDLYGVKGTQRKKIEICHRPNSVRISAAGLPGAVIRDQIAMSDKKLEKALPAHLQPSDWYLILNWRVFFWLTKDRLHRLLKAKAYRDQEHDVLEVDTRSLINAHRARICFCPYNSGSTVMNPVPRDENTFARIASYPYAKWRRKRKKPEERIVELTVDYSVPDVSNHVRRVLVKRNEQVLKVLFER